MHEPELLKRITRKLDKYGWLWYHPHISILDKPGYPDITATRDGEILFIELKSDLPSAKVDPNQKIWHTELRKNPHVEVHLWAPADLEKAENRLRETQNIPSQRGIPNLDQNRLLGYSQTLMTRLSPPPYHHSRGDYGRIMRQQLNQYTTDRAAELVKLKT